MVIPLHRALYDHPQLGLQTLPRPARSAVLETKEMVHRTGGRSSLAIALAGLALQYSTVPAAAQADDAAKRGSAAVDTWCRMCHVRTKAEKSPDLAPPFQEIVERPGRDKAYLRAFLDEDHFPMTTFRLFDHEKDDVVAYILSLRSKDNPR
jgi:hypothetical protein